MAKKPLWIIIIVSLIVFNLVSIYRVYRISKTYERILEAAGKIIEIKAIADGIIKELWGVISVYDPEKSKKVNFEEGRHYELLRAIYDNIRFAKKNIDDKETLLQLDIMERTVNSLARNIDFLKGHLILQELDTESTKIFFKDSDKVTSLKDSYIDEMESMMEKFKIIVGLIDNNVNSVLEKKHLMMTRLNNSIEDSQKRWLLINTAWIFLTAILGFSSLLSSSKKAAS